MLWIARQNLAFSYFVAEEITQIVGLHCLAGFLLEKAFPGFTNSISLANIHL